MKRIFSFVSFVSMVFLAATNLSWSMACRQATPPTFTRDVAPILFGECAACHHPNGVAPFSVLTFAEVKQRARTIVTATNAGLMPPWLPAAGHGEFAGERRLTRDQIDVIRRWEEAGALEGNAADLPQRPAFDDGWQLGTPDLIVKLPEHFSLPASGPEVWRNFVVRTALKSRRFVKTAEFRPGPVRVIHHALLGIDTTRSSRRRDGMDAEPGFEGMDMGDSQAPDGHLLGWSPGMTPFPGVAGKAWTLEPGTDIVLQLHMIPSGKAEVVDPLLGLYFSDAASAGAPLQLMRLDADHAIDIPPGARDFVVTDTFGLPVDLDVLAVYPHAHFIARRVDASATRPDGTVVPLIRIDNWDFKWQDIYRYAKPLRLPKGTSIAMRFSFDNSTDNPRNPRRPPARVVAGIRSSDEMAHLQLQVLPQSVDDGLLLKAALNHHTLEKSPRDAWARYELANALNDLGQTDQAIGHYRTALADNPDHAAARNNLGVLLLERGAASEAIEQYNRALETEPDFADAHFNLANALRAAGRRDEAVRHYRTALKLEPDLFEAHNNLGELLASQGRMEQAIAEFTRAVQIRPDSATAHNNLGAALGALRRFDEAIQHFREALRLEPGHAGARENLDIALERAAPTRP